MHIRSRSLRRAERASTNCIGMIATLLLLATASARTLPRSPTAARRRAAPLAYASVGQSGDFGKSRGAVDEGDAQTWTMCCGAGWLYGIGGCIGPFFGTGVGITFPGGVLAGAGGGVGIVFGIGMGSGFVWGGGRGVVKGGYGINPPMKPPFADGLPRPSDLPSLAYLLRRAADEAALMRDRVRFSAATMRDEWRERR